MKSMQERVKSLKSEMEDNKHRNLFAYVSTEDMKEIQEKPKALRRQIRKCNLSKSRLVGRLILGEV